MATIPSYTVKVKDIITDARRILKDKQATIWNKQDMVAFTREARRVLLKKRPEAKTDASGDTITFDDITNDTDSIQISDDYRPELVQYVLFLAFSQDGGNAAHRLRAKVALEAFATLVSI